MHSSTIIESGKGSFATQRKALKHAEDIEDKKAIFICMVATSVTLVLRTM